MRILTQLMDDTEPHGSALDTRRDSPPAVRGRSRRPTRGTGAEPVLPATGRAAPLVKSGSHP